MFASVTRASQPILIYENTFYAHGRGESSIMRISEDGSVEITDTSFKSIGPRQFKLGDEDLQKLKAAIEVLSQSSVVRIRGYPNSVLAPRANTGEVWARSASGKIFLIQAIQPYPNRMSAVLSVAHDARAQVFDIINSEIEKGEKSSGIRTPMFRLYDRMGYSKIRRGFQDYTLVPLDLTYRNHSVGDENEIVVDLSKLDENAFVISRGTINWKTAKLKLPNGKTLTLHFDPQGLSMWAPYVLIQRNSWGIWSAVTDEPSTVKLSTPFWRFNEITIEYHPGNGSVEGSHPAIPAVLKAPADWCRLGVRFLGAADRKRR